MAITRIPLVGNPSDRFGDDARDFSLHNCFIEQQDDQTITVVKRPGITLTNDGTGEGRGVYTWNGAIYTVIDTTLYRNHSSVGTGLTGDGRVYFNEESGASAKLLIKSSDGLWTYTVGGGLVEVTDPQYPGDTVAGLEYIDTYTCVLDSTGVIHSSDVDDPTSWATLNQLEAQIRGDDGVAVVRHINYLVVLGSKTTEIFYDASNDSGSPFSRLEGTPSLIGCAAGGTGVNIDKSTFWVTATDGGGHYVAQMQGFTPERVSNIHVEKALNDYTTTNLESMNGFYVRIAGHAFLLLSDSTGVNYVYDVDMKAWARWEFKTSAGDELVIADINEHDNDIVILAADGDLYTLDTTVYQDAGQDIDVIIRTNLWDGDTEQNKFMNRLELICDTDTDTPGGDVTISWTDDDYENYSLPVRTVSYADERKFVTRLGRFQRRAFKIEYSSNTAFRARALEASVRRGHYGR